jgi:hypothetical protein
LKKECEHAIYQYEAKYPDSFVDGEVCYYWFLHFGLISCQPFL